MVEAFLSTCPSNNFLLKTPLGTLVFVMKDDRLKKRLRSNVDVSYLPANTGCVLTTFLIVGFSDMPTTGSLNFLTKNLEFFNEEKIRKIQRKAEVFRYSGLLSLSSKGRNRNQLDCVVEIFILVQK